MTTQFVITTKRRGETTEYIFDASELKGSKELFVIQYWKYYVEDKERTPTRDLIIGTDGTIYEDYYKSLRTEFCMLNERQRDKINQWLKSLWETNS